VKTKINPHLNPETDHCVCEDFCSHAKNQRLVNFRKFARKYRIELLPWQEDAARNILAMPCASGITTLIALLFNFEKESATYTMNAMGPPND